MRKQSGIIIDQIIDLIESHLDENMDLYTIAGDFNYSKYYLPERAGSSCGTACHVVPAFCERRNTDAGSQCCDSAACTGRRTNPL